HLSSRSVCVPTYADDTAILARSSCVNSATDKLQILLKRFENWACRWNVAINTDKCAVVTFALRRDTCPGVFLHGQLLPQREEHTYLGLVLDKRLTFASHIKKTRAKLENTARRLSWVTCPKSKLSLRCKTRLYQSLLAPISN
ncbi:hypothetical protein KR032_007149, partial [Drosophila birchii]